MTVALRFALALQALTGAVWTGRYATTPGQGDFSLLGLFLLVFAVQAAGFFVGLLSLKFAPGNRRKSIAAITAPVLFSCLPLVVRTAAGGYLSTQSAILFAVGLTVIAIAACFIAPRRVACRFPQSLLRNRALNGLLLAAVLAGWLVLAAFVFIAATGEYRADTGYGLAHAIILAAYYVIGLGAGALAVAAWAWLGLRGGVEGACRSINVAQLIVATPGLVLAGLAVAFLLAQNAR